MGAAWLRSDEGLAGSKWEGNLAPQRFAPPSRLPAGSWRSTTSFLHFQRGIKASAADRSQHGKPACELPKPRSQPPVTSSGPGHTATFAACRVRNHLMMSCMFAAMASGSSCTPLLKLPTVCPLGLGGSLGSRVGGGLALRSCINLSTPPMMLPPLRSRSYTCAAQAVELSLSHGSVSVSMLLQSSGHPPSFERGTAIQAYGPS